MVLYLPVEVLLQACHTFAIEADSVKSYITEKKQIPYMTITTDYSISDQGQIDTRIGTFIELLQHLFFVLISLYLCYGI
ncbi:2-hydroxyacyl-CoA dehydratase [[Clostridium] scindens]|uniref:2-hydroxyacyl-CoA dehydratase n=1 Tax=Clostridium scindens (strain JCM 10418 / VPI 12708) TaxID=29347 RepID=UPI0012EA425C|nr:2-hydroxyacyl-CoA dehydratase [[Clostridium] scindens]MBO1683515.1 2-hydroxyacyl-CoA dehydratase [[Clostridium] scindens]MEE0648030.1 2-hydroxyacyl-CoA dehydratase [[Clostridium] scindens]